MADPNLTESAWQRAKADAAGAIETPHFGIGAAIVGLLFAAGAFVIAEGEPVTTQAGASIFFGVLSIAVTLIFIFLAQLVAAPVRQRNELREAWDLGEPVQPIKVELALRNERRKAGSFYRVKPRGGGWVHTREDETGAEEWTNRIVGLLSEHVDEDAAREFIEAPRGADGFKAKLDAQTAALDRIIDRLD